MSDKKKSAKKAAEAPSPLTKAELIDELAKKTGQDKKVCGSLLDAMGEICAHQIKSKHAFKIPNVVAITATLQPAQPARPGRSPKTGEMITFKAKPASFRLKAGFPAALKEAK